MQKYIYLLLCSLTTVLVCAQPSVRKAAPRVGFYNVENLFDLEDEPVKFDEEFTPMGAKAWTPERYRTKLNRIAQVISDMGKPALMGLAEVENASVLQDLVNHPSLLSAGYQIIHREGPDLRGIDVALIFREDQFRLDHYGWVTVPFPDYIEPDYTSRELLFVEGWVGTKKIHVVVNHWPSRRGGMRESEAKRLWVADHVRHLVDQWMAADPAAAVILIGDFNDEPHNQSVSRVLGALTWDSPRIPGQLYNATVIVDGEIRGSYNYRGRWNMLDQVIVSSVLAGRPDAPPPLIYHIFSPEYLRYRNKNNNPSPNRTYGGNKYFGGYSDHFPVYIELWW